MSLTYGFYNSLNHDRLYDAIQMSSIFDGIINDGVYMSIGDYFFVKADTGMTVTVGTGRAWFNHTWTLNDALIPLEIPEAEVILNRIDAIVLEVNSEQSVRANAIKVIKGTPTSQNPQRPTLINNNTVHQHPLAYVYVGKGVTALRQANITNMVGTDETPFVTGIIETIDTGNLLSQWSDQWYEFSDFWKQEWRDFYSAQTLAILEACRNWEAKWEAKYAALVGDMEATHQYWKDMWAGWYYPYINSNTQGIADWKQRNQDDFDNWFNNLHVILDGDVAAHLTDEILSLKKIVSGLTDCCKGLKDEHALYDKIYDNNYMGYGFLEDSSGTATIHGYMDPDELYDQIGAVQDASNDDVLDSDTDTVNGRTAADLNGLVLDSFGAPITAHSYQSGLLLDSNGNTIESRVIFAVK